MSKTRKKEASPAKTKIIAIVGPNASGKSTLSVKVAKKVGGEVISADSRQVYRGMDIGTGKVTKKEMAGIPHHLLDVSPPKREFNVFHFKKLAEKKIKEIAGRGKIPVIVGGTGFWIDALLYDWQLPKVKPNKKLRAKLEKESTKELFRKLKKLDPRRARAIDPSNKRRLIRAIEIVLTTKRPVPELKKESRYDALIIGLRLPHDELDKRIYKRLLKRLKQGLAQEVKKLHKSGVSWKRLDDLGLEYCYVSRYLRGLINYRKMVDELNRAIRQYAKRQMTWFKRNQQIHWVETQKDAIVLSRGFTKALSL